MTKEDIIAKLVDNCVTCNNVIKAPIEVRIKRKGRGKNKCTQCIYQVQKESVKRYIERNREMINEKQGIYLKKKRIEKNTIIGKKCSYCKQLTLQKDFCDDINNCCNGCKHEREFDKYMKNKIHTIKKGARNRGIEFNIEVNKKSIKDIYKKQGGLCAISGIKLNIGTEILYNQLSLDRIDNSKGYTLDNIQMVCVIYNYMKNTFTDKECKKFMIACCNNM